MAMVIHLTGCLARLEAWWAARRRRQKGLGVMAPDDRKHPVTYEDCEDIGYGFLPVIQEGEPPPEEEHYIEARRIEHNRQLARHGLPVPPEIQ